MTKTNTVNEQKLQATTKDDIIFRTCTGNNADDKIISRQLFLERVLSDTEDLSEGAVYTMRKILENTKEFKFCTTEEALLMIVTTNEYTVGYKPILREARLLVG